MKKNHVGTLTVAALLVCFLFSGKALAFHPLITDDTGTQGKGKFQLEFNGKYDHDSNDGVTTKLTEMNTALTYGIVDTVDVVVGMPYDFVRVEGSSSVSKEDGISDLVAEVKWRFYEKEGLSFAVKPGFTLPTGDDEKGLGSGRATYHLFLITTKELKPWTFHINLGYIRNENKVDDMKNIWHASLASELGLGKNLKACANIGVERNPIRNTSVHPAFILGGLVWSLNDRIDLDMGVKGGLNNAEPDYTLLAGITIKF